MLETTQHFHDFIDYEIILLKSTQHTKLHQKPYCAVRSSRSSNQSPILNHCYNRFSSEKKSNNRKANHI